MTKTEVRATIPMPVSLRDRIKVLGKLEGRPFNAHALRMLQEATERAERKVQVKS
jgi:hypothetical protein